MPVRRSSAAFIHDGGLPEGTSGNIFGGNYSGSGAEVHPMQEERIVTHLRETAAPESRAWEFLDARDLPPPRPLKRTLERLEELGEDAILVQLNDRAPQHLYPQLSDRGYVYDTIETGDGVVTAIWTE